MEPVLVLILLVVVVVLLATERLRADLVAMVSVGLLIVLRLLPPDAALAGFANPATVTIACMFVLSAGLESSGFVQFLGDRLLQHGPSRPVGLLLLMALVIGPVSAFINNTAAVALFLPVALHACSGRGIAPGKVLMGLSFFAMMGGTCTLIGTSTNILVSSIAADRGRAPFGMFEFAHLGGLLFLAGAAYLLVVGHRLMPEGKIPASRTESFRLNRYLSEVIVLEGSALAGKSLVEARLGERYDLEVLSVIREGRMIGVVGELQVLEEGDILLVKAPAAALLRLRDTAGIAVRPGRHPDDADLASHDSVLMEAVVPPNSLLEGRTLKRIDFRHRFGATVLAIRRHGADMRDKIGRLTLQTGDEMLLLADRHNLERMRNQRDFVLLQEIDVPVLRPRAVITAAIIIAGVVATAATGLRPVSEAAIVGAVLMVLTGCLPVRRVYQVVDWQVVFLLAGLIPLGMALEQSGAAQQTVKWMLWLVGDWGPRFVLVAFFLLGSALTGFMSNTATAALLAPLALTTAAALGVDARPFLIALTFAASAAFYTPIGYQTNLLVYGPGGYRFADFLRAGGPLTLLYAGLAGWLIPYFFPF